MYNFFKSQKAELHNSADDYIGTNGIYLYADKNPERKTFCLQGQHIVIAPHEGIVDSDVWIKTRLKCMNNKQIANPQKSKNTWLVGKIKCGKCGYAMTIRKSSSAERRYFVCSHRMRSYDCEGVGGIRANDIEDVVFDKIKRHLEQKLPEPDKLFKEENTRYKKIRLRLAKIEEEIEELIKKLAAADEVLTNYITVRVNALDTTRKFLINELEGEDNWKKSDDIDLNNLNKFIVDWDEISFEEKKMVADALITAAKVTENNVEIVWKS